MSGKIRVEREELLFMKETKKIYANALVRFFASPICLAMGAGFVAFLIWLIKETGVSVDSLFFLLVDGVLGVYFVLVSVRNLFIPIIEYNGEEVVARPLLGFGKKTIPISCIREITHKKYKRNYKLYIKHHQNIEMRPSFLSSVETKIAVGFYYDSKIKEFIKTIHGINDKIHINDDIMKMINEVNV